jgi:asparagine synthetase B (glutamine-hydrolysing)
MFNFTYNNHLKYSIGGREFGYRKTGEEKYTVSLGKVDPDHYRTSSYQKELLRISDLIYKDFGKDTLLFLSGGTDSEIVLRSFLKCGIKPRCCTIKLKGDYNAQDVSEAQQICKDLDVNLEIIEFDVKEFYYSGQAHEFASEIQCTQVTYLMIYYHVLKLSAPSVMGGELLLSRQIDRQNNYWYYTFRENEDASAMRFSNRYNVPLVNEFFSYTPEIVLYFLRSNLGVYEMLNNPYKLTSVSSKNEILSKLCPEIRNKNKSHGFEKLLAFNYEIYRSILSDSYKRLEFSLDGIPLSEAFKQLQGDL